MKVKILTLLISLLASFGMAYAQSDSISVDMKKVDTLIRDYMFNNIGDYDSYAPISYGQAEVLKQSIENDITYLTISNELIEQQQSAIKDVNLIISVLTSEKNMVKDIYTLVGLGKEIMQGLPLLGKEYDDIIVSKVKHLISLDDRLKEYKATFENSSPAIGIAIDHKYRAKNKFGGTEIYEYRFGFDQELSKVIKVEKIE